jgi:repressor LexA
MPPVLYKKQRQILDYLKDYTLQHGHSPTLAEIAKAIGVRSLATVHEHLQTLVRKGVIRRYEGVVRGIEVLDNKISRVLEGIELPILGFIAAGEPIETYTDPNATLQVAPFLLSGTKKSFVLQVKGSSMIEDGIFDGDYVVVEEQETANNGDIVVALLEGGVATMKRFYKERDHVRLEPANSSMKPIIAKNVTIQGKVVGVIRKY